MEIGTLNIGNWSCDDSQLFWGHIAPCEHVLQIYNSESEFLDVLLNFTVGGIRGGECTIVIATEDHLNALNDRLLASGFDPFYLKLKDKYIPLDAAETLARFTVNDWPDENLFQAIISGVLVPAKRHGTPIRAFGEMVALQWKSGNTAAALELERLWNNFLKSERMTLFCAYPRMDFSSDSDHLMMHVCGNHTHLVAPTERKPSNDIMHTAIEKRDFAR
jgi:hypothetical protein